MLYYIGLNSAAEGAAEGEVIAVFEIPTAALQALAQLQAAGFEACLVGGCVRDFLLGSAPKDFDMTTSATPEEIKSVFAGDRLIETGLQHGTVTVLLAGEPLEITTYRQDGIYSDNRHPDCVAFTRSLREDLARRDFTINAMAYSPETGLSDFYGGQADLAARTVRCVGDADRRFGEDALRMLRALRFAAVLDFRIAPETAAAMGRNRALLRNVSAERVREELTKLLCGAAAGRVLRSFPAVLGVVVPELLPAVDFDQCSVYHHLDVYAHTAAVVDACPREPVLRWAALFHDLGKPATFSQDEDGTGHFYGHPAESRRMASAVMERLKFDRATRERVLLLVEHHDVPPPEDTKAAQRRLHRWGEDACRQLLALGRGDNLGQSPAYQDRQALLQRAEGLYDQVLAEQRCFSLRDLAIKGDDLLELGYRGKAVGQNLDRLLDAVIDGQTENTKEALITWLRRISP